MTFLRVALAILLVCGLSSGYFLYGKWQALTEPHVLRQPRLTIAIPRGATFEDALALLAKEDILTDILPLRVYLKVTGSAPIVQAGNYQFHSPVSPLGVMDVLRAGAHSEKLTILEGWNRFDIARAMRTLPALKLQTDTQALPLMSDLSLISDIDPLAKNLEGYLYPDTYFIVERMTPREVVRGMVTRFRKVWKEHLAKPAYDRKVSIHDVVTVASIIETEAKLESERPKVASVIYNRLSKGMPLGVDSTVVYAAKIEGKWRNNGKVYQSDIDRRSPYNTRIFKGLPPGPVGSPGLSSLMAALNPEHTTYLYYVRNPYQNNGAHNFYSSAAEFENGVTMLRNWEKKQAQNHATTTPVSAPQAAATTPSAIAAPGSLLKPAQPAYMQNPLQVTTPNSSVKPALNQTAATPTPKAVLKPAVKPAAAKPPTSKNQSRSNRSVQNQTTVRRTAQKRSSKSGSSSTQTTRRKRRR
jgi:UPF0755 protein